jgi:N-acetylmuramoyl-L-alanine amidase
MDRKINGFKSRGVRKADFYVLRGSLMPAVLLEVGFITNGAEAKSLEKGSYQKLIAESIADGIAAFIFTI